MIILGISCYYHDSAAAIIKDGEVVAAAQEERFSRIKHDNGFPYKSIEFCLDELRIAMNEIDVVVFYEKPILKFERILQQHINCFPKGWKIFFETIPSWVNEKLKIRKTLREKCHYVGKIMFIDHHLSHAAASFLTSPFEKAAILTIDGVGEWTTTSKGIGDGIKISLDKRIVFPDSLGLFYSAMTAYLGFKVNNDEYKVMGLSGYGDPKPYYKKIKKLIEIKQDGSFKLDQNYFSYQKGKRMFSKEMNKLLGGLPRKPESSMTKRFEDIAAAAQLILEEAVFKILNKLYEDYKCENLVMSGGVALNSLLNGKILKMTPFKNLYITPDPGDGGAALGAALYVYHSVLGNKKRQTLKSPYLGPKFEEFEIEKVFDKYSCLKYRYIESREELLSETAKILIDQKVIGWFQGRMEWGPRALGNRSILAAATKKKMQDVINAKVKHREMFRPFAPVILREKTGEYFEIDKNMPVSTDYMLLVYPFKKKMKTKVPAVVHVDGTGRLQTIGRNANELYYDLIDKYYQKTGIPLILNTSFNIRGEPIVCTPEDAVKCFMKTEIDYLIINNYVIEKI